MGLPLSSGQCLQHLSGCSNFAITEAAYQRLFAPGVEVTGMTESGTPTLCQAQALYPLVGSVRATRDIAFGHHVVDYFERARQSHLQVARQLAKTAVSLG